ncbi:hypothetical protein BVC80_8817g8 [Macleaya cordata]|uniref:Uncharacterized protein n=1 Tax=Macleaya cordata TaxID=56857 RepID=A0A200PRY7_MACCD|nr:hypothetical protein BVC80_8817g8 [Macleaya cordata]
MRYLFSPATARSLQQLKKLKLLWHSLKKNVGGVVDSPALQIVAGEVAKEYEGLPIILVTLGRALRNNGKFVCDDTVL